MCLRLPYSTSCLDRSCAGAGSVSASIGVAGDSEHNSVPSVSDDVEQLTVNRLGCSGKWAADLKAVVDLEHILKMPGYGFALSVWVSSQHQPYHAIFLELLLDPVQPHLSMLLNGPGHLEVVGSVHASFLSKVSDMALAFQNLSRVRVEVWPGEPLSTGWEMV